MPKAYLIYNPAAGRFPPKRLAQRAADTLRQQGWSVRLVRTKGGEHITELAQRAAAKEMDALFLAGGDGPIGKAVAGLVGTKTALGVLPSGTANVWAQELGLPGLSWMRWLALEESAGKLAHAPARGVDAGVCNGTPFLLWAGVGLGAFVVHHMEPRQRWEKYFGIPKYAAAALRGATEWRGLNLQVEVDGERVSGSYILAVVSNIRRYAGGLAQISPEEQLDDGIMDLWLFDGETFADVLRRAWDLLAGRHVQSDQVQCFPFRHLRLESEDPMAIQLDGDPVDAETSVTIDVLPQAMRVLVPPKAVRDLFTQPGFETDSIVME